MQVRDYVRRRRWIRSRVRKPAEQQTSTAASSASASPIFGQAGSRPELAKLSTTSSTGTGPILSRPSGMFATHDDPNVGNTSFSSQRSGYTSTAGQQSPLRGSSAQTAALRDSSSHSLGGIQPGRSAAQEDRAYMNLSEVRQGLSSECSKWGESVVSELHKAISSTGDGECNIVFHSALLLCKQRFFH